MTDEQLLTMFRKYKKKRNIIIISILIIIISSIFIFLSISNTSSKNDAKSKEITNVSKEFSEAKNLYNLLNYFEDIPDELVPRNSLLREFIGGSIFEQ